MPYPIRVQQKNLFLAMSKALDLTVAGIVTHLLAALQSKPNPAEPDLATLVLF